MSVVCIMGRRFSGSTILCRLLDASPDVFAVGETRALLLGDLSWSCKACKGDCRIIPKDAFVGMPPRRLYRQIQKRTSKPVLVTSDKPFEYVSSVTRKGSFIAVFVFKSPLAFAASEKRGHPRHVNSSGNPIFSPISVESAMDYFVSYYGRALRWPRPQKKVFVSLERFIIDMPSTLPAVCDAIGIAPPRQLVPNLSKIPHHFVMGNYDAMDSKKICVDDRWRRELSAKDIEECVTHKKAMDVYKRLLQRSII